MRRDRNSNKSNSYGGGKIVYIKEGIICKRLSSFETKTAETICLELSLKNKKWFILFGYRPESIDRNYFFQEVLLDQAPSTIIFSLTLILMNMKLLYFETLVMIGSLLSYEMVSPQA